MFEKVKALFAKKVYVPEDKEAAKDFDPGYEPRTHPEPNVPGHPAVIPDE